MSSVVPNLTECRLGSVCRIVGNEAATHLKANGSRVDVDDGTLHWMSECSESAEQLAILDSPSVGSTISESSTCSASNDFSDPTNGRHARKSKKKGGTHRLFRSTSKHESNQEQPVLEKLSQQQQTAESSTLSEVPDAISNAQTVPESIPATNDTSGHSESTCIERPSWLIELFESSFFNMNIALQYLFKTEHLSIRTYLVNRLYGLLTADVDFYLLQLVSLYHMSPELAKLLHPYFIHRCSQSTEFASHIVWLLDTFDPPKHDCLRSVSSSALSRPSSVPTFSQSMGAVGVLHELIPTTMTTESVARQLPSSCENGANTHPCDWTSTHVDGIANTVDSRDEYTLQTLRTILFPTQANPSHTLSLSRIAAALSNGPSRETHRSVRLSRTASGTGADLGRSHDSTDPCVFHTTTAAAAGATTVTSVTGSGCHLGHKRTVSDVTYRTIPTYRIPHNQGANNIPFSRTTSIVDDQWFSTASAVEVSREPVPNLSNCLVSCKSTSDVPKSSVQNELGHLASSQSMMKSKVGSSSKLDEVLFNQSLHSTDLTVGLRNACSLQRLLSTPSASNMRKSSVPSLNQPTPTDMPPSVHMPTTTSSSISPPDSGLHFTFPASHILSVSQEPLAYPNGYPDIGPPDPILSLQLRLVPRLLQEWDFVDGLSRLARRLTPITSKEQRTAYLQAELANLNLHLPARVWLPVHKTSHIVLRIPPTAAVCLNSKDKAPYLIYLEVLLCDDPWSAPIPCRPMRHTSKWYGPTTTSTDSFLSLSTCAWNSNTPSSSSPVVAPDAVSLQSTGSVNSGEHSGPQPGSSPFVSISTAGSSIYELSVGTVNAQFDPDHDATPRVTSKAPPSPVYVAASEIRNRLKEQADHQPHRSFKSDPDDPSAAALKEPWHIKCQRLRELSPWGCLPGWHLTAAIVKVGDDLRQEQLAYQLLSLLQHIWQSEYVPLWLRPLTVIVTSPDSGLIEPVPDTVSLHQIRRHARLSLLDYFLREHGPATSEAFLTAQRNFVESCAAYSLVGYLLQVKDRHNGNILVDSEGHVIHIDYGFILSASPGKNLGFEMSPFKLTNEQVVVMGGLGSDLFEYFKCLLLRGLLAARKHMEEICVLVEISQATCPQLPCFARGGGSTALTGLRQRFQLSRTEEQLRMHVDHMVETALSSFTTKLYDTFQYYTNGIQ